VSPSLHALAARAAVPVEVAPSGHPLLVPADEAALARALDALAQAGQPLRLEGFDDDAGPAVSLAAFSRVIGVRADDGVAVVEPGVRWSTLQAALAAAGFESPVRPTPGLDVTVLALASGRAPFRAFHPFGARADWVRDLRLVTPAGTVVRSPYAPRRATGPELRLPALVLGAAWGVPTSLTVRVLPASPHETRALDLSGPDALGALERLGRSDDEASFLAEARLSARSARLCLTWRQATLREPPDELWSPATPVEPEPCASGPTVTVRAPWGDATAAWLTDLTRARRGAKARDVRLWGPDRQGVYVELPGAGSVAEAAAAGLLPPGLATRTERLAALRTLLTGGGAA